MMNSLNDDLLLETYLQAIRLNLVQEFIELLVEELKYRNLQWLENL